jgi:hypothetical protein
MISPANITNRTNASPIYLVLFISATYFLNRPCVYCSLLLAILVIALFDFHSNWFEPRYSSSAPSAASQYFTNATTSIPGNMLETASIVASAMNSTAAAVLDKVVGSITNRTVPEEQLNSTVVEWIKSLLRKEGRIQ